MRILDFFQRAYVINLPQRTDRLKGAEKELKKLELSFTPGKLELFPAIRPTESNGFPSIGAYGCLLSHLSVLKQARNDGLANVLVMEDDLAIHRHFKDVEAALVEQLSQKKWDIAYFGDANDRPVISPVQFDVVTHGIMTTTFYGVNAQVLDRLIQFLETIQERPIGHPDGGPMHLDAAYSTFRHQNPDVTTIQTNGGVVTQRSSRSDIAPNAWYDKLPVAAPILSVMRQGKIMLRARGVA